MKATEDEPVHWRLDGLALIVTEAGTPPPNGAEHWPVAGLSTAGGIQVVPPVVHWNVPVTPARLKLATPGAVQLNCAMSVPTEVQLTTVVPTTFGTGEVLIWAPAKVPVPVTVSC